MHDCADVEIKLEMIKNDGSKTRLHTISNQRVEGKLI